METRSIPTSGQDANFPTGLINNIALRRVERIGFQQSAVDKEFNPPRAEVSQEVVPTGRPERVILSITRLDGSRVLSLYA